MGDTLSEMYLPVIITRLGNLLFGVGGKVRSVSYIRIYTNLFVEAMNTMTIK